MMNLLSVGLASIALALIVAACGGGGGDSESSAQPNEFATALEKLRPDGEPGMDDPSDQERLLMVAVARSTVQLAYLLYGSELCDIFSDAFPSFTTVSSKAAVAESFVEAIDSDLSDSTVNERAIMGELFVEECARQAP